MSFFCAAAVILEALPITDSGIRAPMILLDDIAPQLDETNCALLIKYLEEGKNQVFITTTSNQNLVKYKTEDN